MDGILILLWFFGQFATRNIQINKKHKFDVGDVSGYTEGGASAKLRYASSMMDVQAVGSCDLDHVLHVED